MKKNILKATLVAAFALIAGFNVYSSQKAEGMSDLALANVEALADGENGGSCRWSRVYDSEGCVYHVCVANGSGDICTCGATKG